jgi:hypothetical protein
MPLASGLVYNGGLSRLVSDLGLRKDAVVPVCAMVRGESSISPDDIEHGVNKLIPVAEL